MKIGRKYGLFANHGKFFNIFPPENDAAKDVYPMDTQYYNRNLLSPANNFTDNAHHLIVNCTGCCVLPQAFRTESPHGRNDYYLMYLYAGKLSLLSGTRENGEILTLGAGQLFVFPPHTAYHYENEGNEEIRYLYVHFTGYGAAGLLSDCAIPVGAVRRVGFLSDAEEKFRALFRTFLLRGPCFDTSAAARLMDICVMFGRALAAQPAETAEPLSEFGGSGTETPDAAPQGTDTRQGTQTARGM